MVILMRWTLFFAVFMLVMKPGHSDSSKHHYFTPVQASRADDQARLNFCNE